MTGVTAIPGGRCGGTSSAGVRFLRHRRWRRIWRRGWLWYWGWLRRRSLLWERFLLNGRLRRLWCFRRWLLRRRGRRGDRLHWRRGRLFLNWRLRRGRLAHRRLRGLYRRRVGFLGWFRRLGLGRCGILISGIIRVVSIFLAGGAGARLLRRLRATSGVTIRAASGVPAVLRVRTAGPWPGAYGKVYGGARVYAGSRVGVLTDDRTPGRGAARPLLLAGLQALSF